MFDVPGVGDVDAFEVAQPVPAWPSYGLDHVWSFPRRREFVHSLLALLATEDEVSDHEEPAVDVAVIVLPQSLQVLCRSHAGDQTLFFKPIDVFFSGSVGSFFIIALDSRSSEGDGG
jgi:hypothetical protein